MNYTYHKATEHRSERVDFPVESPKDGKPTICTVYPDMIIGGQCRHACADGSLIRLTLEQARDILQLISEERGKYIHKAGAKSLADWHECGINFHEFCLPGDTVTEDIVEYFVDIIPPTSHRCGYVQVGEPYNCEKGPESGKYRNTYATFAKRGGDWYYVGCCFCGEVTNRVTRINRLAAAIAEIEAEIQKQRR